MFCDLTSWLTFPSTETIINIFVGGKNGGKNKNENKNRSAAGGATVPQSEENYGMPIPSQLMGLAAAWGSGGLRKADEVQNGRKRSLSPQGQEGAKQAKLMVLQQGDGPTIGKH